MGLSTWSFWGTLSSQLRVGHGAIFVPPAPSKASQPGEHWAVQLKHRNYQMFILLSLSKLFVGKRVGKLKCLKIMQAGSLTFS